MPVFESASALHEANVRATLPDSKKPASKAAAGLGRLEAARNGSLAATLDVDDEFLGRHPPTSWSGPVSFIGRHQQQPCKRPCFAISSSSLSAKQLERELGVKYRTAWRMFNKIRMYLMADDGGPLTGEVEADETLVGGRIRNDARRKRDALGISPKQWDDMHKTKVFAAVERDGRVRARVIPNSSGPTLRAIVTEYVDPGSVLYTDEWGGYRTLGDTYEHRTIRHRDRVYVDGSTHTQTVEGFFGLVKNALKGVHHGVSDQWLQGYLNEYCWRYNNRGRQNTMFQDLLVTAATRPMV